MFQWLRKKKECCLPFHTDVHCHVVPGIDDGSDAVEKSVMLLQHMQQWGITHVIPTPHVTEDTFENTPSTIDPPYGALVDAVHNAGIDITLLPPSAEYRIDGFFMDCLERKLVRPLSGAYLLVENNFMQEPWDLDNVIYDLKLRGYQPVMAHPERYLYYHSNFSRYRQLHQSGLLFQCNLLSLGGYYGKEIKRISTEMLENDMIDFLGTDLHGMRHVQYIEEFMQTSHFSRLASMLEPRLLNDKLNG